MCISCLYLLYNVHALLAPQDGDSAVIIATQYHHFEALKELVAAGANLNLMNQVKVQLLMGTAPGIIASCLY